MSLPRHYWLLSTEIQPLISTSVNLLVYFSTINILFIIDLFLSLQKRKIRFNITGQAKAKENSASSSCYFTAAVDHRVINLYTNNYVLFSSSAHTSLHHHDESLSAEFVRDKEVKDVVLRSMKIVGP
ncbi:unnamed protein product [Brassica oleracea]|uniref:(rape) hypothetical protein n=1 Tax=Brassica napus TaxID=3708 RepID=A0A816U8E0_BRANA|nr:unnamed protein product [Brassica napus]